MKKSHNTIRLGERIYDLQKLKSKQELLDYLQEHGSTHASLMDFCAEYMERYQNPLCWPYPISEGKHLGTFLILVREGVLSLPYDGADKENYEHLVPEDARFCTTDDMEPLLDGWKRFSEDLEAAMQTMKAFLENNEVRTRKFIFTKWRKCYGFKTEKYHGQLRKDEDRRG